MEEMRYIKMLTQEEKKELNKEVLGEISDKIAILDGKGVINGKSWTISKTRKLGIHKTRSSKKQQLQK